MSTDYTPLVFNEELHKYTYNDNIFNSITSVLKSLSEEKDWYTIAENYANKHGETPEYWQNKWKENSEYAANCGTIYHKLEEDKLKNSKDLIVYSENLDSIGNKLSYDLRDLKPGIYPELIIYHLRSLLCGTSDIVEIYSDRTFSISDHKTTIPKKMKFEAESFYSRKKQRKIKEKFLAPISHIDQCEGMKYTLQLSLYAYMLEQFGYTCRDLSINHVILKRDHEDMIILENGKPIVLEVKVIPIEYLKDEAQSIIEFYEIIS